MKVAVLDYACGEVAVYEAPEMETNKLEEWLEEEKGHRMSDCYYMLGDFRINIETK